MLLKIVIRMKILCFERTKSVVVILLAFLFNHPLYFYLVDSMIVADLI